MQDEPKKIQYSSIWWIQVWSHIKRSCTKDMVDNRIWREKKQAGAVYIKFFVYLLVYVYLYTQFQKSRAPWSVEFQ